MQKTKIIIKFKSCDGAPWEATSWLHVAIETHKNFLKLYKLDHDIRETRAWLMTLRNIRQ